MFYFRDTYTLITGASSGIGRALAYQIAEQGSHLVLVARDTDALQKIAQDIIDKHQVQVYVYSADLSGDSQTIDLLCAWLRDQKIHITTLINNAGFGYWGKFEDGSRDMYQNMIYLNIANLVALTHALLPQIQEQWYGGVINIASTWALQPCPYISVYAATKAFVLSFSEALFGENIGNHVTITAVCPGNTATGFQSRAQASTEGMPIVSPEIVATKALKGFLAGKNIVFISKGDYLQSLLPRILPRKIVINIVRSMIRRRVIK